MRTREATEMYLKTILYIQEKYAKSARPIDIARYLKLSKASVSEMIKKLEQEGFVEYKSYETIKLTTKGLREASRITRNYTIIKTFLIEVLGMEINNDDAHNEACRLEHDFSEEGIQRLLKLIQEIRKVRSTKRSKSI